MQSNLSSIFDSYSLYAKAFPGISFLTLSILSLPTGSLSGTDTSPGALLAVTVLIVFVFGFAVGQAIHTISVYIESTIYLSMRAYWNSIITAKNVLNSAVSGYFDDQTDEESSESGSNNNNGKQDDPSDLYVVLSLAVLIVPIVGTLAYGVATGRYELFFSYSLGYVLAAIGPIESLRDWFSKVLTPHRNQFKNRFKQDRPLNESFKQSIESQVSWLDSNDGNMVYTSAMSILESGESSRANLFQAIFSFSRSMWVVLFSFSAYQVIIGTASYDLTWRESKYTLLQSSPEYTPIIIDLINTDLGSEYFGAFLFVFGVLFFYSEGEYKNLFSEYIMVDMLVELNKK
ncbi:hypothetical protein ACFQFH_05565 [Halobaculum halobium]|uniref:Uncharacterized protein n=1 Tax=Halobaculum halobium TaxID=3032281 RepID=A0ABD5TDW5_9EURY|nr:hypothetical protein [Halobaculum sp. SYNS20]